MSDLISSLLLAQLAALASSLFLKCSKFIPAPGPLHLLLHCLRLFLRFHFGWFVPLFRSQLRGHPCIKVTSSPSEGPHPAYFLPHQCALLSISLLLKWCFTGLLGYDLPFPWTGSSRGSRCCLPPPPHSLQSRNVSLVLCKTPQMTGKQQSLPFQAQCRGGFIRDTLPEPGVFPEPLGQGCSRRVEERTCFVFEQELSSLGLCEHLYQGHRPW